MAKRVYVRNIKKWFSLSGFKEYLRTYKFEKWDNPGEKMKNTSFPWLGITTIRVLPLRSSKKLHEGILFRINFSR